jgi:hypothetical protein
MELVQELLGSTNTCLTFDPLDKVIRLRKFLVNENDPDDNLGGEYAKKVLPRGKGFEKLTINSAELKFIKTTVSNHMAFEDVDIKSFSHKLEQALDKLIVKYMTWLDGAEERREQERKEAEEERELELEMIASEGESALEEAEHPIKWIADTINWFTAGERMNILYSWLTYCSQIILDNPISVIGIGEASSGKSHILETAQELLPQESVLRMKSATMAATYAMAETDPYYFDKKIVYIGDMGGASDHEEAEAFKNLIKELQTDGEVKRVKMVKGEDGEQSPKWFELYGYPCLTYTNVPGHDFDGQELSRSVLLTPRTDNDEAFSVLEHLYGMSSGPTYENIQYFRNRIPVIRNMVIALRQRMQHTEIVNPYHQFINNFLKSSKFFKRDYRKYNGILKVITAINGYNREIVNGVLFTTVEDILIFSEILERYQESIRSNLSPNAADILKEMRMHSDDWDLYDDEIGFTVNDYMARSNYQLAKRSFQQYFGELNASGLIKVIGRNGRTNNYILMDTNIGIKESDINMSDLDQKILKYNYGIECEKLRQLGGSSLPGDLKTCSDPPLWDEYLPEQR